MMSNKISLLLLTMSVFMPVHYAHGMMRRSPQSTWAQTTASLKAAFGMRAQMPRVAQLVVQHAQKSTWSKNIALLSKGSIASAQSLSTVASANIDDMSIDDFDNEMLHKTLKLAFSEWSIDPGYLKRLLFLIKNNNGDTNGSDKIISR